MKRKTALTIAGSDCCGGAGIQADIKTMTLNGVYAMSAITALTAQNTTGVLSISEVAPEFLADQLDMIFRDISPDAVKTGMLCSAELIEVTLAKLTEYGARNIVIDPVMLASSGRPLLRPDAVSVLKERLLPICRLTTPNIPEAETLTGIRIQSEEDMLTAAGKLAGECGCAVLLKGGHSKGGADDLLYENGSYKWFRGERVANPNTHGTGCTLSSAVAANLAKGYPLFMAILFAKEYMTSALSAMLDLGKGPGPLDHGYMINNR